MTYRILSIEDNPDEAKLLEGHVQRYAQERELDLTLVWKKTAFDLVDAREKFDLVFLDIELPGIDGMEAAELIRSYDSETPIIFITNLAQYAVKGYQVDALDFVVKPVSYFDFRLRMDKAMRVISRHTKHSITIPIVGGFRVANASDIVSVEVRNHDLNYSLVGNETLTARGSLTQLETTLADSSFVRVSNSCLVNMAHIKQIKGSELEMSNGSTIYFSRAKKKSAMETIANYLGGSI